MSRIASQTLISFTSLSLTLLALSSGGLCCSDWCVASNEASDAVVQKALDWVCMYGSACNRIKPDQPCYKPDDLKGVATVAFNQYWQQVKKSGTQCDLFGASTLVHTDPSRENCTIPCV